MVTFLCLTSRRNLVRLLEHEGGMMQTLWRTLLSTQVWANGSGKLIVEQEVVARCLSMRRSSVIVVDVML